jgi:hypothetical protein
MVDEWNREWAAWVEGEAEQAAWDFMDSWRILLQLALPERDHEESARVRSLLRRLPETAVVKLMALKEVRELVTLWPPVGSIKSHRHEELRRSVIAAVDRLAILRDGSPRDQLDDLYKVLRQIRNCYEHGFKLHKNPRDAQIMILASRIVKELVEQCRGVERAEHRPETNVGIGRPAQHHH